MLRGTVPLVASILCAAPLPAQARPPKAAPDTAIRLVVHIAVDQFRPDYFLRWENELDGGLGWLFRQSVAYLEGEQDHAITETAPGHASMLSGRWPYSTGIITNDRGVPDRTTPLIGSNSTGASPRRFRGTTLSDWMRAADPDLRVLSVSRKDRGAILPVGRAVAPVFWHSNGRFTTSRWYADSLPTWLQEWNAADPVEKIRGTSWTLLKDESHYPEPDFRPFESGGNNQTFPHVIPDDWTMAAGNLEEYPVMDSLILDVAWRGFKAEGLGKRNRADFLAVSLSTTDAVGHRYGHGSREMHDQVLRLDRQLAWFWDSLATIVPRDRMIVTMTADHGSQEYPENGTGGRVRMSDEARALNRWALERWKIRLDASEQSGLLLADVDALVARGVDVDSISRAIAARMVKRDGIWRVYTPATLATWSDLDAERWRRQLNDVDGWLVAASVEPGWLWSSGPSSTGHGTTNLEDVRVPVLVRAPGITGRKIFRSVGVVDIAPTVAALLGIEPTEPLDGRPLFEVVRPPR